MRKLTGAAVLVLCFVSIACDDSRKWIIALNDLQEDAAKAYDGAKAQEQAAGAACVAAWTASGHAVADLPDPAKQPDEALAACASVNAPIPFNPVTLANLAVPVNIAYDSIRAADGVRLAVEAHTADPAAFRQAVVAATLKLLDVYDDATALGIKGLDRTKVATLQTSVAGGSK